MESVQRTASKFTLVKHKAPLPLGVFEAILSTDDLDRHGEHVSINGMDIPKDQTIKMYYNHETNGASLPIGKWDKIWKQDGKLMGKGQIDLDDDFALKVYKKIIGGFLDSISIGFSPQEFDGESSTWTKSVLVEASVVAEPANVNARITSKSLDFTEDEFNESLKVKLKGLEPDSADPAEEPELLIDADSDEEDGEEPITVKRLIKGAVEDVLLAPKKWELMRPFYDIMYAFEEAYYDDDTEPTDFQKLLNETIGLLKEVADGTYKAKSTDTNASDESGASVNSELKAAIEDLNSRQGALEAAFEAANENPAKKNIERVRVALKQVDQSVEEANRIAKVQLRS